MTEQNYEIREDEGEPAPDAEESGAAEAADPGALSPRQERALQALLSHSTLKESAAAASVSETTLWRYMNDPEFSRRLRTARREALGHAALRLQGAAGEAATFLRGLMAKEDAPASARVTAARTLLDYSFRVAVTEELQARVDELEQFILRKQEQDALDRGQQRVEGEEEGED